MAGRVDEVDEEARAILALLNEVQIVLRELIEEGEMAVDLIVMQRSCSSLRMSVKRVSPAPAEAMMPALHTRESFSVDLPWSTWR